MGTGKHKLRISLIVPHCLLPSLQTDKEYLITISIIQTTESLLSYSVLLLYIFMLPNVEICAVKVSSTPAHCSGGAYLVFCFLLMGQQYSRVLLPLPLHACIVLSCIRAFIWFLCLQWIMEMKFHWACKATEFPLFLSQIFLHNSLFRADQLN